MILMIQMYLLTSRLLEVILCKGHFRWLTASHVPFIGSTASSLFSCDVKPSYTQKSRSTYCVTSVPWIFYTSFTVVRIPYVALLGEGMFSRTLTVIRYSTILYLGRCPRDTRSAGNSDVLCHTLIFIAFIFYSFFIQ